MSGTITVYLHDNITDVIVQINRYRSNFQLLNIN